MKKNDGDRMNKVPVPTCFLAFFLSVVFTAAPLVYAEKIPDFSSFITTSSQGHIDWDQGLIYGTGHGSIKDNNNSRARAMGAANMAASGNIIKLAANMNLNDTDTLQSYGKGLIVIKLKAFLQDRVHSQSYVRQGADSYWQVTRVAHINGIKGLTSSVLKLISPFPAQKMNERSATPLDDEEKPWLLVDARSIQGAVVAPALFPRVVTQEGRHIHSLRQADQEAVIQRGMARYVTAKTSLANGWTSQRLVDAILRHAGILAAADTVFAAEPMPKSKRRRSFIVAKAEGLSGLRKTNLIISEADARKLQAEDNASAILKNCRVIIMSASPIGGVEGRRLDTLLASIY